MAFLISYVVFCVLVWSLWIKKLLISSNTDTQTQRFAVEYQQIISHPEVTSTGSPKQRPVVETKVSDMMEVVTGSSAAFIRKVDERNEAVLKTQELSSKLTKLEDQLTSSNLKLQELQNVHEEFVQRHEIELEDKQRMICELEEKYLRLMHNESSLRRIIDDKDRLLQSKETEYVVKIDRQNKTIGHLLDQLIDMDRIKEEVLKKLATAEVKPETCDVGCGSDEPLVSTDSTVVTVCSPSEPGAKEEVNCIDDDTDEEEGLAPPCPSTGAQQSTEDDEGSDEEEVIPRPEIVNQSCPAESLPLDITSAVMEQLFPSSPPLEETCQPKETSSPTETKTTREYYIMSDIMKTVRNKDIVVNGICSDDYGRVVGRQGKNVDRIESEYGVSMSLNDGKLVISGGDAEKRRDAAQDVIDSLPVLIVCPHLPLGDETRITNMKIKDLNYEYQVKICRPSDGKKNGSILGRIDKCRIVYDLLKNASNAVSG
jgi:hypothetical protein